MEQENEKNKVSIKKVVSEKNIKRGKGKKNENKDFQGRKKNEYEKSVAAMEIKNNNERAKNISIDFDESINELGETNCDVEAVTEGNKGVPVIEMMKINDENVEREGGIEVDEIKNKVWRL